MCVAIPQSLAKSVEMHWNSSMTALWRDFVLYSVGSCAPTQRSWTITDFILHLHLHCRSIEFEPVSVWFPVSRLSLQLFCLPSLMLRSLHLIEVESIIAKKKKNTAVWSKDEVGPPCTSSRPCVWGAPTCILGCHNGSQSADFNSNQWSGRWRRQRNSMVLDRQCKRCIQMSNTLLLTA